MNCKLFIRKDSSGFTLIELLVVIAIIGVLSTIALTSLSAARAKARDAQRKTEIEQIKQALDLYYADHGQYPPSGGSVAAFQNNGWSNSGDDSWNTLHEYLAPYLPNMPKDPVNDPTSFRRTFNYYSQGYGCPQQWYMLIYGVEAETPPATTTIQNCQSSPVLVYYNAVVVQDCKGC